MKASVRRVLFFFFAAGALMFPAVHGQQVRSTQKNSDAEWPTYNRDLAGTRFSPLTQINARNVGRLVRAWTYKVGKVKAEGITGGARNPVPVDTLA